MKPYLWLACIALTACATSQPAPVIDRAPAASKAEPAKKPAPAEKDWRPGSYTVKKGDTLYGIGMEFGFDYKEIAQWNNLVPPYVIRVGQQLRLTEPKTASQPPAMAPTPPPASATEPPPSEAVVTPLATAALPPAKPLDAPQAAAGTKPAAVIPLLSEPKALKTPYGEQPALTAKAGEKTAEAAAPQPPVIAEKSAAPTTDSEVTDWAWPASGKMLAGFNDGAGNKGVDISGTRGQPVHAAASGKVVYSGAGLRGYGKLVIIKHNSTYLSAYAHNSQILVREGQEVGKGQKIAEMGDSDADRVKLHFEIRKFGKPIDPMRYLPANSR